MAVFVNPPAQNLIEPFFMTYHPIVTSQTGPGYSGAGPVGTRQVNSIDKCFNLPYVSGTVTEFYRSVTNAGRVGAAIAQDDWNDTTLIQRLDLDNNGDNLGVIHKIVEYSYGAEFGIFVLGEFSSITVGGVTTACNSIAKIDMTSTPTVSNMGLTTITGSGYTPWDSANSRYFLSQIFSGIYVASTNTLYVCGIFRETGMTGTAQYMQNLGRFSMATATWSKMISKTNYGWVNLKNPYLKRLGNYIYLFGCGTFDGNWVLNNRYNAILRFDITTNAYDILPGTSQSVIGDNPIAGWPMSGAITSVDRHNATGDLFFGFGSAFGNNIADGLQGIYRFNGSTLTKVLSLGYSSVADLRINSLMFTADNYPNSDLLLIGGRFTSAGPDSAGITLSDLSGLVVYNVATGRLGYFNTSHLKAVPDTSEVKAISGPSTWNDHHSGNSNLSGIYVGGSFTNLSGYTTGTTSAFVELFT